MKPDLKYRLIEQCEGTYPVQVMCKFYGISRSGYYRYKQHKNIPAKDASLADMIAECQCLRGKIHGYRYMQLRLEKNKGIHKNPKTVLRVMRKYGLLSEVRRRRWQGCGQSIHRYNNILNRNFKAEQPNKKWVTDISYIPQHKASSICRLFVTSLTTASLPTRPVGSKALTLYWTLCELPYKKRRSPGSYSSTATKGPNTHHKHTLPLLKNMALPPSMSRRGNPYDNAMAENFFSMLKTECIYRQKIQSFEQGRQLIDGYGSVHNFGILVQLIGIAVFNEKIGVCSVDINIED